MSYPMQWWDWSFLYPIYAGSMRWSMELDREENIWKSPEEDGTVELLMQENPDLIQPTMDAPLQPGGLDRPETSPPAPTSAPKTETPPRGSAAAPQPSPRVPVVTRPGPGITALPWPA